MPEQQNIKNKQSWIVHESHNSSELKDLFLSRLATLEN